MDHGHRRDGDRYPARAWGEVQDDLRRGTSPVCGQTRPGLAIAGQVRLEEVGRGADDRRGRSWILATGRIMRPADEGEEALGAAVLVVDQRSAPIWDQLV